MPKTIKNFIRISCALLLCVIPGLGFAHLSDDLLLENNNYVPLDHAIARASHAYVAKSDDPIDISPTQSLAIGVKIWNNECGGTISGLTSWNFGEHFASLGIGHFLWYPSYERKELGTGTFPDLVKYIVKKDPTVYVPEWLFNRDNVTACPWNSRSTFVAARYSNKMRELRTFLHNTIALQAQYMVHRLKKVLPYLLRSSSQKERNFIYAKFNSLMQTGAGTYALVDYLNFKGGGIDLSTRAKKHHSGDWGLLQVLEGMQKAPANMDDLTAFVWSARQILIRRVYYSKLTRHEERWLIGWLKRIDKYGAGKITNG